MLYIGYRQNLVFLDGSNSNMTDNIHAYLDSVLSISSESLGFISSTSSDVLFCHSLLAKQRERGQTIFELLFR